MNHLKMVRVRRLVRGGQSSQPSTAMEITARHAAGAGVEAADHLIG
ncbi:hypothetical protein GYA93_12425 [Gordonia desulfuricans]|uniref:Uncharacterized protein n=1 Tax=Gordonia desulfuricans TaxID=89051 RepID=A0A7K3LQ69_9ACTN|nr:MULTISPECIES: hypothetical protein [Gordonia]NDK90383.1 hypothetical protein [Gordonia desulfuricans]WLP91458.1 hypothetical protein Q9K23_04125 [Gordonia sp. NB41Y]